MNEPSKNNWSNLKRICVVVKRFKCIVEWVEMAHGDCIRYVFVSVSLKCSICFSNFSELKIEYLL